MAVSDIYSFDYSIFDNIPVIQKGRKKGSRDILDIVTAFDIEATRIEDIEQSVMYIWQFQIEETTVVGRTWDEWFDFLLRIEEHIKGRAWLVIYVHNLSYEISFLKGWYDFEPEEVFVIDKRKVLKCTMFGCIEYRCSYCLTNMSLDALLKKYNVEAKKLTGMFDYSKIRWPWTELDETEMTYCINDVKGLVQALKKQLASDGDTVASVPLTATGYVRRDVRAAMKQYNHKQLKAMLPGVKVYKALREAFRGGDTLSNRWQTDEILENIGSADIISSYPASMLLDKFPMSAFILEDPRDFDRLYRRKDLALLFRVVFIGIDLKSANEGHAYLSRDKCRDIEGAVYCNGRILRANYLETTLTDVDFGIIKRRYKWMEMHVFKLWSARYGMLPLEFRNVIMDYYRIKTELKGVAEDSEEHLYYMKAKEKLNSCYGMCVEDPGKDQIVLENGEFVVKNEPLYKLIRRHNASAFLNYAWGVWVAARSRKRLADGIDVVTKDDPFAFVYSDTDSVKYLGSADFSAYNAGIIRQAEKLGVYAADRNGVIRYLGIYEDEGYPKPNRFKTLGAKKYVIEYPDGSLHITIAGVNKRKGGKELGKLENFTEGFTFREAGGTESIFNDNVDILYRTLDGHTINIRDNVAIRPSTYTLGITAEYKAILDGLIDIKYSDHDIPGLYKVKS